MARGQSFFASSVPHLLPYILFVYLFCISFIVYLFCISFIVYLSLYIFLCISFFVYLSLYIFLCISFFVYLSLYIFLCISLFYIFNCISLIVYLFCISYLPCTPSLYKFPHYIPVCVLLRRGEDSWNVLASHYPRRHVDSLRFIASRLCTR